jgi:hypothetical protein
MATVAFPLPDPPINTKESYFRGGFLARTTVVFAGRLRPTEPLIPVPAGKTRAE